MSQDANLDQLKTAYEAWHNTRGASQDVWLGIMSDAIRVLSMDEHSAGLSFAKDRFSKQEMVDYFSTLLAEWTMDHWTPDTYVCDGDTIAMFGHCAWIYKANGNKAECRVAHLWRFKDGKIVEFTEVFDSAKAVAAVEG